MTHPSVVRLVSVRQASLFGAVRAPAGPGGGHFDCRMGPVALLFWVAGFWRDVIRVVFRSSFHVSSGSS